jgi:hypothetical protein
MERDDRGDTGFMEAMVAMMVVVAALMVYLSSTGAILMAEDDPMAGFDMDALGLDYGERRLDASTEDYIRGFVDRGSASGAVVVATVPGTDMGEVMFSYGDITGHRSSATHMGLAECESGRWMAVVFGVTVCA